VVTHRTCHALLAVARWLIGVIGVTGPLAARQVDVAARQEPIAVSVDSVTAVTWPAYRNFAAAIAAEAARPVDWPGLGRTAPRRLSIIIAPTRAVVDSLTQGRAPAWAVGFADPGSRTILLAADAPDIHTTLRHELAHLALHQQVPGRVPLWFDEGYAGWAAGEWSRLGGLDLNLAVARGAVPSLRDLDGALRRSRSSVGPSYALAMTAVLELARRHPEGTLEPLLARLRRGDDFDAAVLATTGLPLPVFEAAWRRSVRSRYTIATWLVAGGAWGLIGAAVVAIAVWRRRRDRVRRAALDQGWPMPEPEPGEEHPPVLDRAPGA
jgi:hypothetical protein